MQRKQLLDNAEEKLLDQKLELMFTLRALGEDYSQEYSYVKRVTQELVYRIPSFVFLVPEEHCAQILLSLYEKLEKIIFSYRISACVKYTNYLIGVVRLRLITIEKERKDDNRRDYIYSHMERATNAAVHSPEPFYYCERMDDVPEERKVFYGKKNDCLTFYTSLKECVRTIECHVPRIRHFSDPRLQKLYSHLREKANRRNFVFIILSAKGELDDNTLWHLANVLDVTSDLMFALAHFRDSALEKSTEKKEKEGEIKNHHWLRYISLANALESEVDEEKKAELTMLRDRALAKLHSKCEQLGKMKCSLSCADIASLMGLSRSYVSKTIQLEREALSTLLQEGL